MITYITHCKKCAGELPEPVPEYRIGEFVFMCPECITAYHEEVKDLDRHRVPGQDKPYQP